MKNELDLKLYLSGHFQWHVKSGSCEVSVVFKGSASSIVEGKLERKFSKYTYAPVQIPGPQYRIPIPYGWVTVSVPIEIGVESESVICGSVRGGYELNGKVGFVAGVEAGIDVHKKWGIPYYWHIECYPYKKAIVDYSLEKIADYRFKGSVSVSPYIILSPRAYAYDIIGPSVDIKLALENTASATVQGNAQRARVTTSSTAFLTAEGKLGIDFDLWRYHYGKTKSLGKFIDKEHKLYENQIFTTDAPEPVRPVIKSFTVSPAGTLVGDTRFFDYAQGMTVTLAGSTSASYDLKKVTLLPTDLGMNFTPDTRNASFTLDPATCDPGSREFTIRVSDELDNLQDASIKAEFDKDIPGIKTVSYKGDVYEAIVSDDCGIKSVAVVNDKGISLEPAVLTKNTSREWYLKLVKPSGSLDDFVGKITVTDNINRTKEFDPILLNLYTSFDINTTGQSVGNDHYFKTPPGKLTLRAETMSYITSITINGIAQPLEGTNDVTVNFALGMSANSAFTANVHAEDAEGNTASETIVIHSDTVIPEFTMLTYAGGSFSARVTDSGSGVDTDNVVISLESGGTVNDEGFSTANPEVYEAKMSTSVPAGEPRDFIKELTFSDRSGNKTTVNPKPSTLALANVSLNSTAINAYAATDGKYFMYFYKAAPTRITGTITSDYYLSNHTVRKNGTAALNLNLSTKNVKTHQIDYSPAIASEGQNTIVLSATDSTGHLESVTYDIVYDKTAPVVPNTGYTAGRFKATVTDNFSGIKSWTAKLSNGKTVTSPRIDEFDKSVTIDIPNPNAIPNPYGPLPVSDFISQLTVTDWCGNVKSVDPTIPGPYGNVAESDQNGASGRSFSGEYTILDF